MFLQFTGGRLLYTRGRFGKHDHVIALPAFGKNQPIAGRRRTGWQKKAEEKEPNDGVYQQATHGRGSPEDELGELCMTQVHYAPGSIDANGQTCHTY